jgi:Ran GTPase-activating protein (RanGAP) involved in mRNA processing and transport
MTCVARMTTNLICIFEILIENIQTISEQNLTLKQLIILRETNKKIKVNSDIIQPFAEAKYTYTRDNHNTDNEKAIKHILKSYNMFRLFKIISLDIYYDQVDYTTTDYINSVLDLINNHKNLIHIKFTGFSFYDIHFEKFAKLFSQLPFLSTLKLKNCIEKDINDIKILTTILPHCQVLSHLNLSNCDLKFEHIKILSTVLSECNVLTTLDLSFNFMGHNGLQIIAEVLPQCTNLNNLDLSYNNSEDLVNFIGVPPWSTSLVHIDLSDNGIARLGNIFSECSLLTYLNLCGNAICTKDIEETEHLQEVFKQCTKLVTLYLDSNELDDNEKTNLSEMLSRYTLLKELSY